MKYILRDEILPAYYEKERTTFQNLVFIDERSLLSPKHITALHYHTCFEFGICLSGSGEMHIDNRIYRFSEGDISIISTGVPHFSKADINNECRWTWIFSDIMQLLIDDGGHSANALITNIDNCYNGVFSPDKYPNLAQLINILRNTKVNDEYKKTSCTYLTGEIINEAIQIGNIDSKSNKTTAANKLKPALVFIQKNYMDPQCMSAKKIAECCGLSVSQFRDIFKHNIGMTLPQYINQTRLSSAVNLLNTTNESITKIATKSGFYEISYFNRLFRKTFGMSPKEMRQKRNDATVHSFDYVNMDIFS